MTEDNYISPLEEYDTFHSGEQLGVVFIKTVDTLTMQMVAHSTVISSIANSTYFSEEEQQRANAAYMTAATALYKSLPKLIVRWDYEGTVEEVIEVLGFDEALDLTATVLGSIADKRKDKRSSH